MLTSQRSASRRAGRAWLLAATTVMGTVGMHALNFHGTTSMTGAKAMTGANAMAVDHMVDGHLRDNPRATARATARCVASDQQENALMASHRTTRALGTLAISLSLALTAAGCGDDDATNDSNAQVSTTQHNDADVTFATDMIQHHAQALSMVDLTLDRDLDPKVQQLADDIREAQGPEIETMSDWLTDWNEKVPETMRDHANAGHDMGDMGSMDGMDPDMPGMMSAEDMKALQNASDAQFQTMWLQMMVEHHTGAIEMAKAEQADGQYKPAVDLAGDIVKSQSAEIDTMNGLSAS
jgi:uncharacterized protein (DUF305 family)